MIDSDRLYTRIGARVKQLRETHRPRKLSQSELAKVLGLTRTSVTNIERGQQKMTLDTIFRLCEHFKIEIAQLVPPVSEVQAGDKAEVVIGGHVQTVSESMARFINAQRASGQFPDGDGRR